MERAFLPIFAILIGLGILTSFVLNIYFDHQAKQEIEVALDQMLTWTNNQDKESLVKNVVPEELSVFKYLKPNKIEQRKTDVQAMFDLLSKSKYSFKDFSVIGNKQRQAMALSVNLLNTETNQVENYNFIAINYRDREENHKWIITKLLTFKLKSKEESKIEHQYSLVDKRNKWFEDRIKNSTDIKKTCKEQLGEIGISDKEREKTKRKLARIEEKISAWEQKIKECEEVKQQINKRLQENNISEKKTRAEQRKAVRTALNAQEDIEKRKRTRVETSMTEGIRESIKKLRDLVNNDNEAGYQEWVTFDRNTLSPSELEKRKSEALKIFNLLKGSTPESNEAKRPTLEVDKTYLYSKERYTGMIVRVRFQEIPPSEKEPISQCPVCGKLFEPDPMQYNCIYCKASFGPSGWNKTNQILALLTGVCLISWFLLFFAKRSPSVRNTMIVCPLIMLIFLGLTIYSKETEKAKYTPLKVYKPTDILFLEVMDKQKPVQLIPLKPLRDILLLCQMNKHRQVQWIPVKLIGVKDTQTLKTMVNQEWQKRTSQCDFPSKKQTKRIN